MDEADFNNENTPRHRLVQNEKRKPLESPFSAFSPAQRLAKKKGRVLCEPSDSNLETTMFDDSVLEKEDTDSLKLPLQMKPKVLFNEGTEDAVVSESLEEVFSDSHLDGTLDETPHTDVTFSSITRPIVPDPVDPNLEETFFDTTINQTFSNLDETALDQSLNQTYSNLVAPLNPSSIDPNLEESLLDYTMNQTFSTLVVPLVPSSVDPNLDETLAETTINQTQLSTVVDTTIDAAATLDDDDEDDDVTLDGNTSMENLERTANPISLFDELSEITTGESRTESSGVVPLSPDVMDDESVKEGAGGVSLFDEMQSIEKESTTDEGEEEKEKSMMKEVKEEESFIVCGFPTEEESIVGESVLNASVSKTIEKGEGVSLFEELEDEADSDDEMEDESEVSMRTARGPSEKEERKAFYGTMKQRLSQINVSFQAPFPWGKQEEEKEVTIVDDVSTPTRSKLAATPPSGYNRCNNILSETLMESPGTPSNKFNVTNDMSFLMLEAQCTKDAYEDMDEKMRELQEELALSREKTEKAERERDNVRKEVDDYVFMMEEAKKRMMQEKGGLNRQIYDLEEQLTEARRMSSVVEEEGRKVIELEEKKGIVEKKLEELEKEMTREAEVFLQEKFALSARVNEMERLIEEERKKSSEETERKVEECRLELERKMEEIMQQKNELISQLEKMECESGEKEYSNEESERRLEGEKAMLAASVENLVKEKGEMMVEFEKLKMEKDEADAKMEELTKEFTNMKGVIVEMDEIRKAAFEESRHLHDLNAEVEELKKMNEDLMSGITERDTELETLRLAVANSNEEKMKMEENEKELAAIRESMEKSNEEWKMLMEEKEKEIVSLRDKVMVMAAEITKNMEENEKELISLREEMEEKSAEIEKKEDEIISLRSSADGNIEEMKEKVRELEREKEEMERKMQNIQMEGSLAGKMESRMEEMMGNLMKKTEDHFRETSSLKEEIIDLKRKVMEAEVEMKAKELELQSAIERRFEIEGDLEKMRGENEEKIESMMVSHMKTKEEMEIMKENNEGYTMKVTQVEGEAMMLREEMKRMEIEKEEMNEKIRMMSEEKEKGEMEMNTMNEEMKRRLEEMERELEENRLQNSSKSTSEESIRAAHEEMNNVMKQLSLVESTLSSVQMEKEEAERRANEESAAKEDAMREIVEMKKQMEEWKTLIESQPIPSSSVDEEIVKNLEMELEKEKAERQKMADLISFLQKEKEDTEREVKDERERNDVLSETVKQLEMELDVKSPISNPFDDRVEKLKEELDEERQIVARMKKEQERLEAMCDEFDEIEEKLKESLVEKQKKIDEYEGKVRVAGPALLDALKPTTTEIKAMDETVVLSSTQSISSPREIAGREEEEEEMKEEKYGTPMGSMMEEDDRDEKGEETMGVTKMDGTRYYDEEDLDVKSKSRAESSCRQS